MRSIGIASALFAGLVALPAVGQAPLLQVGPASRTAKGGWQVTLTNRYSSPVTAFALFLNGNAGPGGHQPKSGPLARHFEDAVPGPATSTIRLGPGQSRTVGMGPASWQNVAFTDVAVIYADGTSAGDPAMIAHFLRIRRAEAADLADAIAVLSNAQPDPALAPDVPGLIQTFTQRRIAHAAALHDGLQALPPDRICGSVVATLKHYPGHESPQAAMFALKSMFSRWLTQLQASKPSLAGVSGP